ncbi:MAG: ATP synthase F1 subunit delta [Bdellovibrionota bacterium]
MNSQRVTQHEPVSKLYAKALFEMSQEKGALEKVQEDFFGLIELVREQPQLKQAFSGFLFSKKERESLAKEFTEKAQLHPLLQRFASLLIEKDRFGLLENVYDSFRELVDESKNTVRGTVVTVEPLTEAEKTDLSKTFARRFNKQVVLEPVIDKELLGGLIVKIQGLTFDGSLKTTIRRLKENLERQSI